MKFNFLIYYIALFAMVFTSCKKRTVADEIKPAGAENTPSEESITKPVAFSKLEKADSFYFVQSAMIKEGAKYDPSIAAFTTLSKYDVVVYRIQYKTTFQERVISASGIVCIPVSREKSWPVLSYHHGTVFANSDAPTNNKNDQFVIASLSSAGYIVSTPDYIGFGASFGITHPYYVAEYAASASRDLLLATQEYLDQKKISTNGKLFLAGYSQGGNVTMAVSKSIDLQPIPGFELIASAAGAGGYNMEGIFTDITSRTTYPSPNYVAYIIESYRKTYQFDKTESYYFREPYASRIPSLINGLTGSSEINNQLTTVFDSLIQPGFVDGVRTGTDSQFKNALKCNSLHNWKPTRLLRIYHSDADEVVPFSDSEETYNHMLGLGSTTVSFVPIQGKNHGQGSVPMIAAVIEWFNTLNQ